MPTSEAMATMIQLNLTVRAYNTLREKSLKNGGKTFPPYKEVQKLRETCKPSNIIYRADEIIATIQDTRDHQLAKLFEMCPEMIEELERLKGLGAKITYYYKFGGGRYSFV